MVVLLLKINAQPVPYRSSKSAWKAARTALAKDLLEEESYASGLCGSYCRTDADRYRHLTCKGETKMLQFTSMFHGLHEVGNRQEM
jgi:hypothetical protein